MFGKRQLTAGWQRFKTVGGGVALVLTLGYGTATFYFSDMAGNVETAEKPFDGIYQALENETGSRNIRVLLVHGMGRHCLGWADEFIHDLATRFDSLPESGKLSHGNRPQGIADLAAIAESCDKAKDKKYEAAEEKSSDESDIRTRQKEYCKQVGTTSAATPPVNGDESCRQLMKGATKAGDGDPVGYVRLVRFPLKKTKKTFSAYELTWAPSTRIHKTLNLTDDIGVESLKNQSMINNFLKRTLMSDAMADPVLFLGQSRREIQAQLVEAFCHLVTAEPRLTEDPCSFVEMKNGQKGRKKIVSTLYHDPDPGAGAGTNPGNTTRVVTESSFLINNKIFIITHSLGSYITFDTLKTVVLMLGKIYIQKSNIEKQGEEITGKTSGDNPDRGKSEHGISDEEERRSKERQIKITACRNDISNLSSDSGVSLKYYQDRFLSENLEQYLNQRHVSSAEFGPPDGSASCPVMPGTKSELGKDRKITADDKSELSEIVGKIDKGIEKFSFERISKLNELLKNAERNEIIMHALHRFFLGGDTVFMLANQLPLLDMNASDDTRVMKVWKSIRACVRTQIEEANFQKNKRALNPENSPKILNTPNCGPSQDAVRAADAAYLAEEKEEIKVAWVENPVMVGFTDVDDPLSYYASVKKFEINNITLRNKAFELPGIYRHVTQVHGDYFENPQVLRLIICGGEKLIEGEVRPGKCYVEPLADPSQNFIAVTGS